MEMLNEPVVPREAENLIPENPGTLRSYAGLAAGIAIVAVAAGLHISRREEVRQAEIEANRRLDEARGNVSSAKYRELDHDAQRLSRIRGALEDGVEPDPEDLQG